MTDPLLNPNVSMRDVLRRSVSSAALDCVRDVMKNVERDGSIPGTGINCHYGETSTLLRMAARHDGREVEDVVKEMLPPWWQEIKDILNKAEQASP